MADANQPRKAGDRRLPERHHFPRLRPRTGSHHPFDQHHPYGGAYSIWIFEGGAWSRLEPCGQPGCECTPPPQAGTYEGQVLRKECSAR